MQKAVGRKTEGDRASESDWNDQSTGRGFLLTAYCLLFSLCLCASVAETI
jgi:hypothetical protein